MKLFNSRYIYVVIFLVASSISAQEKEYNQEEMPMAPPQPLNDSWNQWMVGEWAGTTTTEMGKSEDWMKVELAINNQFVLFHYRSKTVEVAPEMLKQMTRQMKISEEDARKIMMAEYQGMGLSTRDPKTGKLIGYWFDGYRDISHGTGTVEGDKNSMHWKSPMIDMERTTEKIDENTMKITFSGKDAMGNEFTGISLLKRKK